MYIESVPNRDSPPAILLRESYREAGKVKKRTLLNLSDWPHERIAGFKALLKGGTVIPKERDAITIIRSLPHVRCRPTRRPPASASSSLSGSSTRTSFIAHSIG